MFGRISLPSFASTLEDMTNPKTLPRIYDESRFLTHFELALLRISRSLRCLSPHTRDPCCWRGARGVRPIQYQALCIDKLLSRGVQPLRSCPQRHTEVSTLFRVHARVPTPLSRARSRKRLKKKKKKKKKKLRPKNALLPQVTVDDPSACWFPPPFSLLLFFSQSQYFWVFNCTK